MLAELCHCLGYDSQIGKHFSFREVPEYSGMQQFLPFYNPLYQPFFKVIKTCLCY